MTIKQKQCLLFYLGYYVGNIDGQWGTLSKTATKAFQKDFGLTADGNCGTDTEKALKHAVAYGISKKEEASTSGDFWDGIKSCDIRYNPNNSAAAIEGILSPDGRVFGKMGHSERIGAGLYCNVPGNFDIGMFASAVRYFR